MIVRMPRFAGHHARATSTHIFRDTLLCDGVNIQTRQVYGNMHRCAVLQSARLAVHGAPGCFLGRVLGVDVVVGSTTGKAYAPNPQDGQEVSTARRLFWLTVRQRDSLIPRASVGVVSGVVLPKLTPFLSVCYTERQIGYSIALYFRFSPEKTLSHLPRRPP